MIPLKQYPEPPYFAEKVRQPGRKHLRAQGIKLSDIGVEWNKFKDFWKECRNDLKKYYNNYCAYTCLYIHDFQDVPIDHIKPKTRSAAYLAYEWNNYCLCCQTINRKKGNKIQNINPYYITKHLFFLILNTGYIYVNCAYINSVLYKIASDTIQELDLNNEMYKKIRQKAFCDYIKDRKEGTTLERALENLKEKNIFVWSEVKRQYKNEIFLIKSYHN